MTESPEYTEAKALALATDIEGQNDKHLENLI